MDRAISPNEVEVVNWLLNHALVDVTGYRLHAVEELRVVGRCGCGCASLYFEPEGQRGKVHMLADELAGRADSMGTRRQDRVAGGIRHATGVVAPDTGCLEFMYLGTVGRAASSG
jgi:hypothetical protein